MSSQSSVPPLQDIDLPPIFHAADKSSLAAQHRFLTAVAVRLISLCAAGAFGLATWKTCARPTDWAGVLAMICFFVAVMVEVYLLRLRPERTWYEGRAAAESVKTLTWRYSVGGEPFNIDTESEKQTDALFLRQLNAVLEVLKDLDISPPPSAGPQITATMRQIRSETLDTRKRIYELGRVADQQQWYQRKSTWNAKRAAWWTTAMLVVEIAGIVAAVMKAVGVIGGDFLIFAGALVAAMTAWLQTKQHQTLATAYAVTALELASLRTKINWQTNQSDWAKFVSEAEEAFSREHTLWKASRGVRSI
jgi:hypothetical protein